MKQDDTDKTLGVKKVYQAPKIAALGTVSSLTQAISNMGVMDGGSGKNHSS